MRILCTADVHIGNCPSRLPTPASLAQHDCASAWEAVARRAVAERVDLVVVAGDLIDHGNQFFEAIGPLERGLGLLSEAGIDVYAVAGNHDFDALTSVADSAEAGRVHLLGRGGRWEIVEVDRPGQRRVRLVGWSFPSEHYREDPLADLPDLSDSNVPTIGVLHADVDAPQSRYAPVSLASLVRAPVQLWVLGHIHRPQILHERGPTILYPGSPQPLDPSETGAHGPWLIELFGDEGEAPRQLCTSSVRYEVVEVDLSGSTALDAARATIRRELGSAGKQIAEESTAASVAQVRLRLAGRTALHGQLPSIVEELVNSQDDSLGKLTVTVEKVSLDTRPAIDLEELARGSDAPAILAGLLLDLESGRASAATAGLVASLHERMRGIGESIFPEIANQEPLEADAARQEVVRQGFLLLDQLVAQKETV